MKQFYINHANHLLRLGCRNLSSINFDSRLDLGSFPASRVIRNEEAMLMIYCSVQCWNTENVLI